MILIVLLAVAPLATLLLINTYERRIDYVAATQRRALDLSRVGAAAERDLVHEIRNLLNVVIELPVVRQPDAKSDCELFLANLSTRYDWVHAIWVANPDGTIRCWQSDDSAPGTVQDKRFFRTVVDQRRLMVEDVTDGTHLTLTGATPYFDERGNVAGVVGVAVSIDRVGRLLDGIVDSEDTIVAVIDPSGTIIAQVPPSPLVGQRQPEAPLIRAVLSQEEGTADVIGLDGVRRIVAYSRILDTSISIAVGINPAAVAIGADRALFRNIILLLIFTSLSVLAAWFGAESLVLRWLRSLSRTMQAIGAGNLDIRADIPDHLGEIAVLGHEINQMAANLRARTQELIEAKDDAVKASRAKADFLATMSHEIRTPLTGIIGFAELVLEKRLTAEQRRYMSYQRDAARALLEIINDILDFSKIEADMVRLDHIPFDLATVIERVAVLLAPAAEQKGLEFDTRLDTKVAPYVVGDPGRLRQILLNLIGNAVKYTDHGKVELDVTLDEPSDGTNLKIRFTVSDTGIGIAREQQQRLFSKFAQVAGVERAAGGTGLGLVISKRLVELMGGEIGVSSVEGVGSNFWFTLPFPIASTLPGPTLPAAAGGSTLIVASAPPPEKESARRRGKGETLGHILVVEDQFLNQELAVAILERAGYQVTLAANGIAALKTVEADTYDLVLMDVEMPVMDGVETTRAIRALPPPKGTIPVIALTAHVSSDRVEAAMEAGANDHASKPLDRALLLEKIDYWLRLGRHPNGQSAEGPPPPAKSVATFDETILEQLKAALGDAKATDYVRAVAAELELRFGVILANPADHKTISEQSHDVVSLAGNIGLTQLSLFAREIYQAARSGEDLTKLLDELPPQWERASARLREVVPSVAS